MFPTYSIIYFCFVSQVTKTLHLFRFHAPLSNFRTYCSSAVKQFVHPWQKKSIKHVEFSFFFQNHIRVKYATLTFEVDRHGAGAALACCGLHRLGGVKASACRPGDGAPLGDYGRLAEGDDGVLVFQPPVVVQRVEPSLAHTAATSTATATAPSVSVHILKR